MTVAATLETEATALAQTAGLRNRDDLLVVNVRGEERLAWLNGQVTNDVRGATAGASVYALAVNVRGKIMADLWVFERGEQLGVLLPTSASAGVLESFDRQIIMEDVELQPEPDLACLSLQGPLGYELARALEPALEVHRLDELGHGGAIVLAPRSAIADVSARLLDRVRAAGGRAVSDEGFELARLRAGRPRFGRDFGEQQYPQEAGLTRLAVSFNKGCYLGQEVVCTLENRGRLSRKLARFDAAPGALPGSAEELRDETGHAVGHVTSAVLDPQRQHGIALGYVKNAHAVAGKQFQAGPARLTLAGIVGEA